MRHLFVIASLTLLSHCAFAIQCGDTVSGTVTLAADMVCNNINGLNVGADNTTINLNGHTISCIGPGFNGSCQWVDGVSGLPSRAGIYSSNKKGIKVVGPGTISGFLYDVYIYGGTGHTVSGLTLTGPVTKLVGNHRGLAIGVAVNNAVCGPVNPLTGVAGYSANVYTNTAQNQSQGIAIADTSCAQIIRNTASNNTSASGGSHGILVSGGSHNTIMGNTASLNGLNRTFDGGIRITYSSTNNMINSTDSNSVSSNIVQSNCGSGITVGPHSTNNNIYTNTSKFNGVSAQGGSCDVPAAGAFHDLTEEVSGQGNIWNANNICHTQTANIPAGVCNPNE